ncbi:hypothetical protein ACWCOW_04880 [Streptomyces sp. NPDC001939]|uniref:hypothetical protein n=1 Tax=Streptomyces TaxID=1883 RepID=UPI001D0AD21E|nr:hypothetical protein [Streptomyces longhuiensis]UDM02072.1 hypothetical protein LGI35_29300 [Streptomyces longhuiensis]
MNSRRTCTAAAAVTASSALLLAGCGDSGELRSAGPTSTAVGPARLWPTLPPASAAADDYGSGHTEVVKGITAKGDDIHRVNPVDVVRAQAAAVAASPSPSPSPDNVVGLNDCGTDAGTKCPVLKAYYRDLTGDGKDELIVGIRLPKGQLAVRCYMFEDHKLTQIMGTSDAVVSVEIAGRDVILRAVADLPGYEYRTAWSWDAHQRAMLPTRDEILRTGPPASPTEPPRPSPTSPTTSPTPTPPKSPTTSPTPTPPKSPTTTPSAPPR